MGRLVIMLFKKIKKWYYGEYKLFENDPNSPVIFVGGYYVKHWTAKFANIVVKFYLEHWKWLWSTIIAITIAIIKLF